MHVIVGLVESSSTNKFIYELSSAALLKGMCGMVHVRSPTASRKKSTSIQPRDVGERVDILVYVDTSLEQTSVIPIQKYINSEPLHVLLSIPH